MSGPGVNLQYLDHVVDGGDADQGGVVAPGDAALQWCGGRHGDNGPRLISLGNFHEALLL